MREILFRGQCCTDGKWVEGYLGIEVPDELVIQQFSFDEYFKSDCIDQYSVKPETIGQYTGLTDKNGKKVFEGDILSSDEYPYTSDDKQNYFAEVVWFDNCPAFGLYTFKAPKSLVRGISEGCELIEDDLSDFEIIGNIYDNPELIGGNTNG